MNGKGYINILSSENEDSIDNQIRIVENYAHNHGYNISDFFIDSTSGTTDPHERQGYINMLESLKSSAEDEKTVFIPNTGVLSRDAFKLLDIVNALTQNGTKVFTALEDKELTKNNSHKVIKDISEQIQQFDQ